MLPTTCIAYIYEYMYQQITGSSLPVYNILNEDTTSQYI